MRIPQVQGLRALAALLVTFFHARLVPGGFVGVDIFYVISGYLITGLILREIDTTGTLNLRIFYQRRIKRLIPSSVLVLFTTALVGLFVLPGITRNSLGRDLLAAATYVSNYLFAWWQNDYQNLNATPSPFIHYWSLAVEEQFYLVWPVFILALSRYGKHVIFRGVFVTTVLSLILSVYQTETSPIWAFYSLPTRAWELGLGALLLFIPVSVGKNRFLPWLGLVGIVISAIKFDENSSFPGINALLPVLSTVALIWSISIWPRVLNILSNNRFAQWLGAISYPLYLWHWPALVLPSSALGRPLQVQERMFCILLTIVLAQLTSKYIEQPIRHREITGRKIYLFFVGATVSSLVAGFAISATASSTIYVTGTEYEFNLTDVMQRPTIYEDGCHANYNEVTSDDCTYGVKSAKTTVVLFGDSHAGQWFPALQQLAIEREFQLISLTKSGCPAVDVSRLSQGAFKNGICEKWRENSIARIQKIHPMAVIISSFQYYKPSSHPENRDSWWADGQNRLLKSLRGASDNLLYVNDTPLPTRDIPSCLGSRDPQACNSTNRSPLDIVDGFKKIDPTSWFCSEICPAILNGYVVYRDASHISVAAALALKPALEAALIAEGLFS